MTTPDPTDPTAVLRDVEWIAEHGACPICRSCRRCSEMDRGVFKGHKADCALAAALATDPTAQIARLRAEVEQAREALAALEARITEALPYAYDDGEDPPSLAAPEECVEYAAKELAELRAEVDRLTRERALDVERLDMLREVVDAATMDDDDHLADWIREHLLPYAERLGLGPVDDVEQEA